MPVIYWWPIAGLVILLSYEIYAAYTHTRQTPEGRLMTYSQMYWYVAKNSLKSTLVFAGGFIAGHLVTWHD